MSGEPLRGWPGTARQPPALATSPEDCFIVCRNGEAVENENLSPGDLKGSLFTERAEHRSGILQGAGEPETPPKQT